MASSHTTQGQHYYILETPLPLRALGLNTFNHVWKFKVSYVFPPPALVPLVLSQVSGRICQRSAQTFDSGGTMLDRGSLVSPSSQHLADILQHFTHCERSHCGYFSKPCAQGPAIFAFNPWLLRDDCCADRSSHT